MEFARVVDLGCGPRKRPGALGVDRHLYPGVDVLCDLDEVPWPLALDQFDEVYASHVIEHVSFIPDFMREIHRISRHGALVHIVTPHFSSLDSWRDPTHRWHLSSDWYMPFCDPASYLTEQLPAFSPVSTEVQFSSSLRTLWPRIIRKVFGLGTWEKHYAFRYPARNIRTVLRVVKKQR
jgi:SAM-dependent methyltransferase